jgi:hypothetical protein
LFAFCNKRNGNDDSLGTYCQTTSEKKRVLVCFEHHLRHLLCEDWAVTWRTRNDETKSVATILERELEATIKEWLRRVNLLPELTCILLSNKDRTFHLPKLFHDLVCRLRLAKDTGLLASSAATAHGQRRLLQGYSPAMLVEESRLFEVVTFEMLHLHESELDQDNLLSAVMVIADEADWQLGQAVRGWGPPIA